MYEEHRRWGVGVWHASSFAWRRVANRSHYGLALYSKQPILMSEQPLTLAEDSSHGSAECLFTAVAVHEKLLLKIACVYRPPYTLPLAELTCFSTNTCFTEWQLLLILSLIAFSAGRSGLLYNMSTASIGRHFHELLCINESANLVRKLVFPLNTLRTLKNQ